MVCDSRYILGSDQGSKVLSRIGSFGTQEIDLYRISLHVYVQYAVNNQWVSDTPGSMHFSLEVSQTPVLRSRRIILIGTEADNIANIATSPVDCRKRFKEREAHESWLWPKASEPQERKV